MKTYRTNSEDVERFWAHVSKQEGEDACWLWTGAMGGNRRQYGAFGVDYKVVRAHVYSFILEFGPIKDEIEVLHSCDVPACVRPKHLFLGTQADNMRDMSRKGRAALVLTHEQRSEIRRRYGPRVGVGGWANRAAGLPSTIDLAIEFDVAQGTIINVLKERDDTSS